MIAGGAALAVAAVVGFATTGDDPTVPAEPSVQQSPAPLIIQDEIDKALEERNPVSNDQVSNAQIVQDEIDKALSERRSTPIPNVDERSTRRSTGAPASSHSPTNLGSARTTHFSSTRFTSISAVESGPLFRLVNQTRGNQMTTTIDDAEVAPPEIDISKVEAFGTQMLNV